MAGSGANTIHLVYSSTFYGDKRGVHQGFDSPETQYQGVENYRQLMETSTTYATHTYLYIPKLLPPTNELLYLCNAQEGLTLAVQPYLLPPSANTYDVPYSNEHYFTYGVHSTPLPLIICLRVRQYNVHPPLSHSFAEYYYLFGAMH